MPRTDDNWFIKPGYTSRKEVNFYEDSDTGSEVVWQPEVYEAAGMLARTSGADVIIDIGCGRASKLVEITDTPTIGVDIGANIDWCRAHYPDRVWIEHDLESPFPLDLGRDFDRAVVVCADVIEHLLDPTRLLALLQGYQRRNSIVLISTPDRDLVRGVADRGPPANPAHVREWNRDEFEAMLKAHDFDPVAVGHTQERSDSPERNTILATAYPSETPMTASPEDHKPKKVKPAKAPAQPAPTPVVARAAETGEMELLRARAEAFQRELETARSRLRADADVLIEARAEAARLQARYEVIKEAHDQRSTAVMDLERLRITLADAEHRIQVKDAYAAELEASRQQAYQQVEVKQRLADELTKARDAALERINALSAAMAETDKVKAALAERDRRIGDLTKLLETHQPDEAALDDARRDAAETADQLRKFKAQSRGEAEEAAQLRARIAEMETAYQLALESQLAELDAAHQQALGSRDHDGSATSERTEARLAELEAFLEDARTDAADVADKLRKLQASTRSLGGEANRALELEAELKALHEELDSLLGEGAATPSNMTAIEQIRFLIEDISTRQARAETQVADVAAELEQARRDHAEELATELDKADKDHADTRTRAEGLEADLAKRLGEIDAARADLTAKAAEFDALTADVTGVEPALLALLGDGAKAPADLAPAARVQALVDALTGRFGDAQERGALELEIRQLKMRAAAASAETLTLRDNAWRLGNRIAELETGRSELAQQLAVVQSESDDKQQTLSELPWRVIGAYRRSRRFIPMPVLRMLASMLPARRNQPPAPPVRNQDVADA